MDIDAIQTPSKIELSYEAISRNFKFIRKLLNGKVRISAVVKGNAYGHGIETYVPAAEQCGVYHFAVFSSDEAKRVFKVKHAATNLMIMGWIDENSYDWVVQNQIECWVFDIQRLVRLLKTAAALKQQVKIHIELETGMNRTGFETADLPTIISILHENAEHFELIGLCTHLAGAESIANHVRIQRQIRQFKLGERFFNQNGIKPKYLHVASSAASIVYPSFRFDMVRIGILQYGYWPSMETFIHYINRRKDKTDPLQRIISWKSSVMAIKEVNRGQFISYGTTYLATENKRIAVIPAGYAYGYSRSLSNSGRVLIRGQRVAVIGLVNMNMLIADITSLPEVQPGDEVVLIGKQENLSISVASFSELSNQLNYELLTRLPSNLQRHLKT